MVEPFCLLIRIHTKNLHVLTFLEAPHPNLRQNRLNVVKFKITSNGIDKFNLYLSKHVWVTKCEVELGVLDLRA